MPATPLSDIRQLLVRYQQGDSPAAAELVRTVSPMLLRFCLSQGDRREDLDDVLQEIWLRIHSARHTYRADAPAEAWLYAVARHTRLDVWRRRYRFRSREIQVDALPEGTTPVPGSGTPSMSELLAELPDGQREVLLLLKGSGMTLEEVARATSCTVGAVKQKAHRAYEYLRVGLAHLGRRPAQ